MTHRRKWSSNASELHRTGGSGGTRGTAKGSPSRAAAPCYQGKNRAKYKVV